MKVKQFGYEAPLAEFIAGRNTIKVCNDCDYTLVKEAVHEIGINLRLGWHDIVKCRNNRGEHCFVNGYACLEYDNYRGLSLYFDEAESERWYERKPYTIEDIFKED